MNVLRTTLLITMVAALFCAGCASVPAQDDAKKKEAALPHVVILATGGTIAGAAETSTQAGYSSGQVGVEILLKAVPGLKKLARVTGEQIANVGSQNMSDKIWLKLAERINALTADKDVDGIVITHGTDTLEETAYFLNLTAKTRKPVVLTCAMRPSTAMSADGPLNIYNAVALAANPDAGGRGVLVATNDDIHSARAVMKTSTTDVQTFRSVDFGLIGTLAYGKARFFRKPFAKHTYQSRFSTKGAKELPRVDVVAIYSDAPGDVIDAIVGLGAKGIVTAGLGNGNVTDAVVAALERARKKGVVVVRAARVPTGYVGRNIELDDDKLGFVASYDLTPQKARVLLRVALMQTQDPAEIQKIFAAY